MAGEPTDQIRAQIAVMYGAVGASASAPSPSRHGLGAKAADQMFDWRAMAREALGDHWAKRSAEEQNEFARLFVNLFEDAYLSKIRLAEADKFRVSRRDGGRQRSRGPHRVVTRNGSAIPVNYLTRRDEAGRWRVYDLDVERISLVRNYRRSSPRSSAARRSSNSRRLKPSRQRSSVEG